MKKIKYFVLLILIIFTISCDEVKLDVVNYGSVTGKVVDGETYLPLAGALVTTTPASVALLTDADGKFTIEKIQSGEVAVIVKKKDYLSNTLSVAIYDNEMTPMDFLLYKDDKNIGNVILYDPVPGNGAIEQPVGLTLQWKVEGKKSNVVLTYSIYIFESNSTVQKIVGEDIDDMEVTVSGLKKATTYFWYVVAKYEGDKIAFSPTWSFKTTAL